MTDKKRVALMIILIIAGFIILYFLLKRGNDKTIIKDTQYVGIGNGLPNIEIILSGGATGSTVAKPKGHCTSCYSDLGVVQNANYDALNKAHDNLVSDLQGIIDSLPRGGWYGVA